MSSSRIEELIQSWGDNELSVIRLRINSLEKWLYSSYEPDKFGDGDFEQRLIKWLDNVASDDDKRVLFKLITEIFYVGPVEFEELYRCAYQGPIAEWLIDLEQIDVCAPNAQDLLKAAAKKTWFCPVSDSFRINAFFHINNLAAGTSLRPDWRSLCEMGDVRKINQYCRDHKITRLVLLEDFVGGGSQAIEAVRFAATQIVGLKVLFVPLIICPDGILKLRDAEVELCQNRPNSLRYSAVMELPSDAFLTTKHSPFSGNNTYTAALHKLLKSTYPQVSGGIQPGGKPYSPYGYPHHNPTGGMVVMYSNTPDNTLPIIHWRPKNNAWNPLFPRHSRD